jgi:hypothetical protein
MTLAQQAYFYISGTYNTALGDLTKKYGDPVSPKNLKALCADIAPVSEQFANEINKYAWPASVKDAAANLAKAEAANAGHYYECANAKTTSDALAAWNLATAGSAEASAMRLALGLPIER